jgi:hypothetical protein
MPSGAMQAIKAHITPKIITAAALLVRTFDFNRLLLGSRFAGALNPGVPAALSYSRFCFHKKRGDRGKEDNKFALYAIPTKLTEINQFIPFRLYTTFPPTIV